MLSKKYRANNHLLKSLKDKNPDYSYRFGVILLKYYTYNELLFSVIVPKKFYKKASKRVYIKRAVKRYLQKNLKCLKTGVYIIILLKPLKYIDNEKIISDLNKVLSKNIKS